jgi:hypothetical protein
MKKSRLKPIASKQKQLGAPIFYNGAAHPRKRKLASDLTRAADDVPSPVVRLNPLPVSAQPPATETHQRAALHESGGGIMGPSAFGPIHDQNPPQDFDVDEDDAPFDDGEMFERPEFTPDEEDGLRKLREIVPNDNGPDGTRTLYKAALGAMTVEKLIAAAREYAATRKSKACLPEFLFSKDIREHCWTCAAIRGGLPLLQPKGKSHG